MCLNWRMNIPGNIHSLTQGAFIEHLWYAGAVLGIKDTSLTEPKISALTELTIH